MKTFKNIETILKTRETSTTRKTAIDDITLREYASATSDYASTTINLHDIDADSLTIRDIELESGHFIKVIECLTTSGEHRDITLFLAK